MKVRKVVTVKSVDKKFADRVFSFPWGKVSGDHVLESLGADVVTVRKPILERPFLIRFDVEVSLGNAVRWSYLIGDREIRDSRVVILIWIFLNLINSFLTALWIGLSLYGIGLIFLFFYEPYITGLAVFRVWYLFLGVLCFFIVWAGIGGQAIKNILKLLK